MDSPITRRLITCATLAALVSAGALSGGCVLFRPYARDLTFVALESRAHTAPTEDRDEGTFRLRFATKRNLFDLSSGNGLYLEVRRCEPGASWIPTSTIYYQGRSLWEYMPSIPEMKGDGPFEYEAFVGHESGVLDRFNMAPTVPADLCFNVYSPSYFDIGGFDSNIAVIPKEAVAAALGNAAPR